MSWCMSARDYVKNAVKNVEEELLRESHQGLEAKADCPYPAGYRAETDVTPELNDDLANRYQQLIGVLRWACELGWIDILFQPKRRGQLESATMHAAEEAQCDLLPQSERISGDWSHPSSEN